MVLSMPGRTAASVCPSYGLPGAPSRGRQTGPPLQRLRLTAVFFVWLLWPSGLAKGFPGAFVP